MDMRNVEERLTPEGDGDAWVSLERSTSEIHQNRVENCKGDVDTLLVFVRFQIVRSLTLRGSLEYLGRFIFCCAHGIFDRVLQESPGGSSRDND